MSVARLLLCYVLLEEYSTNLSAAITSNGNARSTGSNDGGSTGSVATSSSEVVQRDLALDDNNVPGFAKPIGNVTAACRGEAVLSCTIRGSGNYKVAWLRAKDQMVLSLGQRTVIPSNRFSVTSENIRSKNQSFHGNGPNNNEQQDTSTMMDESTWRLHIRLLEEADRGCYMCQLNTNPMLSQLGCVDVLVSPDILVDGTSEGEVTIMEGENATLTCNASGRPQPQVHWRREKNKFILTRNLHNQLVRATNSTGERLELIRVDRKQTGAYFCIAQNEVPPAVSKRVYLRVNFPPSAKVRNDVLNSPLNTDVSLICEIEASPKTINLWTRKDNQPIMSGGRYVIDERTNSEDEWKTTIELKIMNLSTSDVGLYNCSATSSMGTARTSVDLQELVQATTTPHRITSTSSRKIHRNSYKSSYTTPKHNYNRASTPNVLKTTSPWTSRKKYFFSTTTTSTMSPRVPLNKDKNAFKDNEVINLRNVGIRFTDRRNHVLLSTIYSIVTLSLSF